jgi:energy-coupling factor transporter transmembrane protein EcfT
LGAIFFMLIMIIIFFLAIFFIILNTIFIVIWNIRKRKQKDLKKRWVVVPVIFLIISVIVALVPIAYIGFLRYANNKSKDPIVYAESGTILYWPTGEYGSTTNWFEMNGKKYVEFRKGFSNEKFYLDYSNDKLGTPVANIKYNPSASNPFNDFMWILLSGSKFSDQNISTVIPVKNENNFEFFYVKNSPGSATLAGGTYCAEDSIASTKAYYADIANYDTENLECEYCVYTEGKAFSERNGHPYKRVQKNITLKAGTFIEIQRMNDSTQSLKVEIPQKYRDDDIKAIPGTPVGGYKEKVLYAYSKDKMAKMIVNLVLLEGQVYTGYITNGNTICGYPLPDEINQYIKDNVFME